MSLFSSRKKVVIMVNDTVVRAVVARKNKHGSLDIIRTVEQRIPSGIMLGGIVEQPALFIDLLRSLKKKLPKRHAHVLLPEEVVVVVPLRRPHDGLKKGALEEIVRTSLEEKLAEALLPTDGFEVLSIVDDGNRLFADIASASLIDTYRSLFAAAGIHIASVDSSHPDWAVHPDYKETNHLMVGFGERTTSIVLLNGGVPVMKSTVAVGRSQMVALVRDLLSVQTHEAEKIIGRYGVLSEHREDFVLQGLQELLRPLEQELNAMLAAWKAKPYKTATERNPIASLLLYGEANAVPGLHDRMAYATRIPSQHFDARAVIGDAGSVGALTRDESVRFAPLLWKASELLVRR